MMGLSLLLREKNSSNKKWLSKKFALQGAEVFQGRRYTLYAEILKNTVTQ